MTASDRPRIVLDCDPGIDDTFAIFTALRFCDLAAITTVAGNVALEHTTANALAALAVAGAQVPVHLGADRPLAGELHDARHVHGETGLGDVERPDHDLSIESDDAPGALLELTADPAVTLVAIGPLTNVALAMRRDTSWASRLGRIVIMGGSLGIGNVTATAEFNIWADPEAADEVFSSGVDLTMAGLDLTHQVMMGEPSIERLRAADTATARYAAAALDFRARGRLVEVGSSASPMHDPCAVLEVARPDLFERRRVHVAVETEGRHTRGMTVEDRRPGAPPANVTAMTRARATEVIEQIVEAVIDPTAGSS